MNLTPQSTAAIVRRLAFYALGKADEDGKKIFFHADGTMTEETVEDDTQDLALGDKEYIRFGLKIGNNAAFCFYVHKPEVEDTPRIVQPTAAEKGRIIKP